MRPDRPPHERPGRPADVDGGRWDECLHTAGRALAALLLDRPFEAAGITGFDLGVIRPRGEGERLDVTAGIAVAGVAAGQSRGLREVRRSPSDLADFERALGDATAWDDWSDAVARFFERPDASELLERMTRVLYERRGESVPGVDLQAAVGGADLAALSVALDDSISRAGSGYSE